MFTLSKFEWLVLAVALLLCPGFSWSADPVTSLFDRLDRNRDGYLSAEELASDEARNRNWIAVDRDRDGRISRTEFGLIGIPSAGGEASAAAKPQPDAAAGGTTPPKKQE